ncbi:AraC family transcriptional regulator [Vibrio sp. SS-MA-C1-2]|uniref:helix-turn-helix domain-containing protein n=1 Tax=Vibrio sp. SS-MA-C1-2 TaxID=2908646 RepID=UPI001F218C12|nr:AraC family transcriptional regulator [Vibrio sp. SS-MA-C1-2]UJF19946.1 AraC family transcriptional regulator [Vibrio sp. SS-MA-C1-2]
MKLLNSSFYIHRGWLNILEVTAKQFDLDFNECINSLSEESKSDIRVIREIQSKMVLEAEDISFSFYAAKRVTALSLGSFSLTLWSSPTLLALLENAQRYCVAIASPIRLHLNYTIKGNVELWINNYERNEEDAKVTHYGSTLYIATIIHIIHEVTEYKMGNLAVKMNHWPYNDGYQNKAENLMQCEITLDSMICKVCIDKKYLHHPLKNHDPDIYHYALELLRHQAAEIEENDTILQIYKQLDDRSLTEYFTIEDISKSLSMSVRTLNRRLMALNTSYRDILEKYKLEKAIYYLNFRNKSISEISYLLGFSDVSAFSRAFKKWTGSTPRRLMDKEI